MLGNSVRRGPISSDSLADPITYACWSSLSGYFIDLAATSRYRCYQVVWIDLAIAVIPHGLT